MKRVVLCLNAVLCLLMSVVPGYTLVQIMHQNRMPQGGGYATGGLLCQRMLAVFVVLDSENIYGQCVMGYVFIVTTALRLGRL